MAGMAAERVEADAGASVIGVSIPVPEPHATHLQDKRASYGDPLAHLVPPHVTLLGPTAVDADERAALVAHLERVAGRMAPFPMVLRGTGTFRPVSDVVFVQVARGISECEQLEGAVRGARWGEPAAFPYHPHVTVAHDVGEDALDTAFDDLAGWSAEFVVDSFHLYERGADGAWVPLREFVLAAAPAVTGGR